MSASLAPPPSEADCDELVKGLAATCLDDADVDMLLDGHPSHSVSQDGSDVATPEAGFFIDGHTSPRSSRGGIDQQISMPHSLNRPQHVPSWPPSAPDKIIVQSGSTSYQSAAVVSPTQALAQPPHQQIADDSCPASRAADARIEIGARNEWIIRDELQSGRKQLHPEEASQIDDELRPEPQTKRLDLESTQLQKLPPKSKEIFEAYPGQSTNTEAIPPLYRFTPNSLTGNLLSALSQKFVPNRSQTTHGGSALAGFSALLLVTCANYMLGPMRDAAALAVGVSHIPALTLASTVLALGSSVPVGWLFEAPDPRRRKTWKRMGLTRGETQGTSLALFYRVFAFLLLSYALGFKMVDMFGAKSGAMTSRGDEDITESTIAVVWTFFLRLGQRLGMPMDHFVVSLENLASRIPHIEQYTSSIHLLSTWQNFQDVSIPSHFVYGFKSVISQFGSIIYIMFFLVVHLMKLHSLSLIWGVTTEAMDYEENAELRQMLEKEKKSSGDLTRNTGSGGLVKLGGEQLDESSDRNNGGRKQSKSQLRLKRLAFVGFGGTLGGIIGSVIASFAAEVLHLSGLLVVAAILLELSANLSIELGRIMQRHWEEQMKYQSCGDLTGLLSGDSSASLNSKNVDSSMRKSASMSSMKRVASGNFSCGNLAKLASVKSEEGNSDTNARKLHSRSVGNMAQAIEEISKSNETPEQPDQLSIDDNSFKQRLLRGITTILRSRLLMAIFTYNALYASTSVLLSFQRAELVANRSTTGTSAVSNTAFLAKINTASSVAVFALQASGLGAFIANSCGQRGALALMPIIRLCGVILLGWWHVISNGKPPDLILFLAIDECTKVINFAIAKPVRENLWRGLSFEAKYEAKPIVDTLANRWGSGSAAFLVSFLSRITDLTGLGVVNESGERTIAGLPPTLILCVGISAWWAIVSADVGYIRSQIDHELKRQQ